MEGGVGEREVAMFEVMMIGREEEKGCWGNAGVMLVC